MKRERLSFSSGMLAVFCLLVVVAWVIPPAHADEGEASAEFGIREMRQDYLTLRSLIDAEETLVCDMEEMLQKHKTGTAFSQTQEETLAGWLFAFGNVRKSLIQIASRWCRPSVVRSLSKEARAHGTRISFAALLEWYRMAVWMNQGPFRNKVFVNKLNESVPELNIRENEGNRIIATLSDSKLRARIDEGFVSIWKKSQKENTTERPFQQRILASYNYIDANEPALLKAKWKLLVRKAKEEVVDEFYDINVAVSSWIGDTKYVRREPTIGPEEFAQMKPLLRPGDILLERENWYMSNIFLPGFWPHTIIYIGTAEEIEKMGLADHPLVAPHMQELRNPDRHGNRRCVIEAISEGVVLNTIEESCEADYVAAMRPRLSQQEIREVILKSFSHLGKPYDFWFDFQTLDKIVCSELGYRSFYGKLTMNLRKTVGRWVFPSLGFGELFASQRNQSDRQLDFVFFVDTDIRARKAFFSNSDEFVKSLRRPGFDPNLYGNLD